MAGSAFAVGDGKEESKSTARTATEAGASAAASSLPAGTAAAPAYVQVVPIDTPLHTYSILLKRLEMAAKLFERDYRNRDVTETLETLETWEDDTAFLQHLANDRLGNTGEDRVIRKLARLCLKDGNKHFDTIMSKVQSMSVPIPLELLNGERCCYCHSFNGKACGMCGAVRYCTPACQRADYKGGNEHQKKCRALAAEAERQRKLIVQQCCPSGVLAPASEDGVHLAQRLLNHVWSFRIEHATLEQVQRYLRSPLSMLADATGTSNVSIAAKQDLSDVLLLRKWLSYHFAPCTLAVTSTTESMIMRLREQPKGVARKCDVCQSAPAAFCRRCTLMNTCLGPGCVASRHHPRECKTQVDQMFQCFGASCLPSKIMLCCPRICC